MKWAEFKDISEREFLYIGLDEGCYGPQIQRGTKWNSGLGEKEIEKIEIMFGFEFPTEYRGFLSFMNGFDTDQISIDPESEEADFYSQGCYQYPDDFQTQEYLLQDLKGNREVALGVLEQEGYDSKQLYGFVPLFGHRALAVLRDKALTPVLSVYGSDIILLAKNLNEYWVKEFELEESF